MSDREMLIELLTEECRRSCVERNLNVCSAEHCNSYKEKCVGHYADHLISNGVTVQKWIPVSDETRKPKDRRNYFVAYVFGNGTISFFGEAKYHADGDNGYVKGAHFDNEGVDKMRVTHWMEIPPLPEQPKECE